MELKEEIELLLNKAMPEKSSASIEELRAKILEDPPTPQALGEMMMEIHRNNKEDINLLKFTHAIVAILSQHKYDSTNDEFFIMTSPITPEETTVIKYGNIIAFDVPAKAHFVLEEMENNSPIWKEIAKRARNTPTPEEIKERDNELLKEIATRSCPPHIF